MFGRTRITKFTTDCSVQIQKLKTALDEADAVVIGAGAEYLYGVIAELLGTGRIYGTESPELYDAAIANGARLFTANDPAWAMNYLREKGLHR